MPSSSKRVADEAVDLYKDYDLYVPEKDWRLMFATSKRRTKKLKNSDLTEVVDLENEQRMEDEEIMSHIQRGHDVDQSIRNRLYEGDDESTRDTIRHLIDFKTKLRRPKSTKTPKAEAVDRNPKVPLPNFIGGEFSPIFSGSATKNYMWNVKRYEKSLQRQLSFYLKYCDKFHANFSTPDLESVPNSAKSHSLLLPLVEELKKKPPSCASTAIYDNNNEPILYYLGYRRKRDKNTPPQYRTDRTSKHILGQLDGSRSSEDAPEDYVYDGLPSYTLHRYQEAVQLLSHVVNPKPEVSKSRHSERTESVTDRSYMKEDIRGHLRRIWEFVGVHHLVHCWPQQGHDSKELYIGSDFVKSTSGVAAFNQYFQVSDLVTRHLNTVFEILFPEYYESYRAAFEAGKWFQEDSGPFLGRAIVYKLNGKLHADRNDAGPTIIFNCGKYKGGRLFIPQTGSVFSYFPGDIVIFLAGKVWHYVDESQPLTMKPDDVCTPGRISTVFFTPKRSLEELQDKKPGYARKTGFGRFPDSHKV